MVDPMNPASLGIAVYMDLARDAVAFLTDPETTGDELADQMAEVVQSSDLSHAVIFMLVCKLRGVDLPDSSVELANNTPSVGDLILPPGIEVVDLTRDGDVPTV